MMAPIDCTYCEGSGYLPVPTAYGYEESRRCIYCFGSGTMPAATVTCKHEFDMTFNQFAQYNMVRCKLWHKDGEPWSLADWGNALGGEVGELQNIIKKIRRIQTGTKARESEMDIVLLKDEAVKEVADVLIYTFLLFDELTALDDQHAVSLAEVVRDKFNATSEKFGLDLKIGE